MNKIIIFIILFVLFISPVIAEENIKINYTKEYVSQYLGEVITVSFINNHKEYNKITMLITEINIKKQYKKDTEYFLVGEAEISNNIFINLNKIMSITK